MKSIYKIFPYLFFSILFTSIFVNNNIFNKVVLLFSFFFLLKWIFNYRKCTISYLECKIRGVKKDDGIINQIIESILCLNKM